MPGGFTTAANDEEEQRWARFLEAISQDGGVPDLGVVRPVAPLPYAPTDDELLHPDAASRAADAAAVAPQEWGSTSPTLVREEEPEPEPMVDRIDRKLEQQYQRRQAMAPEQVAEAEAPPQEQGDPLDALATESPAPSGYTFNQHHAFVREAQRAAESPPTAPETTPTTTTPPSVEQPFSRDKRIGEARSAYDAATDEMGNPFSPDHVPGELVGRREGQGVHNPRGRWEEEFLRGKSPLGDRDIQMRAVFMDALGGDGKSFADRALKMRDGYEKGIADARMRDLGEQRVPRELAEALAATGNVSPEGAARLKMNSPFVQAYVNGMYGQGASTERIQRLYEQFVAAQAGQNARSADANATSRENKALDVAGANYRAELAAAAAERASRLRKEMGQLPEAQRAELFAANLQENLGIKFDAGVAAWAGDLAGIPPELVDQVRGELARIKPFTTATDLRPVGPGVVGSETRGNISTQQAVERMLEMAKKDPDKSFEIQADMMDAADKLTKGIQAWNKLSDGGQRAFATLGDSGFAAIIKSALMTEQDRALARAVWTPLNELVQKRTGVAASKYEYGRTANEMGLAQGTWAPFNTPGAIEGFLNDAAVRMRGRYELYNRLLGWD